MPPTSALLDDPAGAEPDLVPGPPGVAARRRRDVGRFAAAVAAAWALSAIAYVANVAVLLPVLLLIATASLLRGGQTLLDRLMLALATLAGTVCAAGVVFSVWPFGLHPVAVSGTGFTVLVVIAALTGRSPNLPRPRISDAVSALPALALLGVLLKPMVLNDAVVRLALAIDGEDYSRHIAQFDAIRHVGGYLFMQSHPTDFVYQGMVNYPQGSHLWAALLDGFIRSSASEYGSGMSVVEHYMILVIAGYALLGLAVVWSAQWIARGGLTLGRLLVVSAFTIATVTTGDLFSLMTFGYPSEVAGLTMSVLLVAVLARPVVRPGQQLLTVGSLLIAIGFCYYLFLPAAGLATLIFVVRHRSRLAKYKVTVLITAVVAGGFAMTPPILGLTVGDQAGALTVTTGSKSSRDYLLALLCVVAAGLMAQRSRRSGVWRGYAWCLAATLTLTGSLYAVQKLAGEDSSYYGNKTLHLVIAVLVVGVGALASHLPAPDRRREWSHRPRAWLTGAMPAALIALSIVAAHGLVRGDTPYRPAGKTTWTTVWLKGATTKRATADVLLTLVERMPAKPGTVSYVITESPYETWSLNLYLSAMQRTAGPVSKGLYNGIPLDKPGVQDAMINRITLPIRLIALSDRAYQTSLDLKRRHADRDIEVVRL